MVDTILGNTNIVSEYIQKCCMDLHGMLHVNGIGIFNIIFVLLSKIFSLHSNIKTLEEILV